VLAFDRLQEIFLVVSLDEIAPTNQESLNTLNAIIGCRSDRLFSSLPKRKWQTSSSWPGQHQCGEVNYAIIFVTPSQSL